jgi:2-dehydro-3-deoxyphosphogluconate aldolase/(4S)-4-hydroxy-2-oxoglutarate aldolase
MNNKEDSFSEFLKLVFFLLIKPENNIYSNASVRNSFFEELERLVN